jgi:hypothetical protein
VAHKELEPGEANMDAYTELLKCLEGFSRVSARLQESRTANKKLRAQLAKYKAYVKILESELEFVEDE